MSEVTAVSNVVHVSHQKQIVERVYKTSDGDHKVERTFYISI